MDYGFDLLMNPRKVNKKHYQTLPQRNVTDTVKEHVIKHTNFINQPLDLHKLEEIIDLTIKTYQKQSKHKPYLEPMDIERNIIPPILEKSKNINIRKTDTGIDIQKVNLI